METREIKWNIWYFLLLLGCVYLIAKRYGEITNGKHTFFDVVVILSFVALLLIPLFQEVKIFGIALKKEIEKVKNELQGDIQSLRSDMLSVISFKTDMRQSVINVPRSSRGDVDDASERVDYLSLKKEDLQRIENNNAKLRKNLRGLDEKLDYLRENRLERNIDEIREQIETIKDIGGENNG